MLDRDLNAQFLNRKMRQFWGVTDERRQPSLLRVADREYADREQARHDAR